MGGAHRSRHIIVTHQPKGSNKGRHAVLPPVQCRPLASSPREERKTEGSTGASPHTHNSQEKKKYRMYHSFSSLNTFTPKKPRDKHDEKEKKQREVVCCSSGCVGSSIQPALLLALSLGYTHARRALSLLHTHIGELVQLPCSASSAAAARRNE